MQSRGSRRWQLPGQDLDARRLGKRGPPLGRRRTEKEGLLASRNETPVSIRCPSAKNPQGSPPSACAKSRSARGTAENRRARGAVRRSHTTCSSPKGLGDKKYCAHAAFRLRAPRYGGLARRPAPPLEERGTPQPSGPSGRGVFGACVILRGAAVMVRCERSEPRTTAQAVYANNSQLLPS